MRIPSLVLFGLYLLMNCGPAQGHEVDQFVLPDCEEFEDLGDHWNEILSTAVCKGVASLNQDIELANKIPIQAIRDLMLAKYHSPGTVAWRVRKHLPIGLLAIAEIELKLAMGYIPQKREDRIQSFRASTFSTVYSHFPLLPDPRQLGRMTVMRSSVIKVHDNYLGTDKIGHFIGHGYQYFLTYRASRNLGNSQEDALRHAVNVGTYGPVSENMLVGTLPTGVFSNADQAANYLGMKFFVNLTEPVQLKGCVHPPLLERDGDYWVKHPGLDDQYFAVFISEHLDEVLNPCVYDLGMRGQIREVVQQRADKLLDWYAGDDPAKRNRPYFDRILERCKTYFGEEYGYSGEHDELISLGEICFADQPAGDEPAMATRLAVAPDGNPGTFSVDVSTPLIHELGDSEVYEVTVSHRGDEDLENIQIVVEIPRGLHVTTLAQLARFDRAESTLTWQVPTFEAGSRRAFVFVAKAVMEGTYSPVLVVRDSSQQFAATAYQATVFAEADEAHAPEAVSAGGSPEDVGRMRQLEIDVLGPATHQLGDSKIYEITVFNSSEACLDNVAITMEIPRGLQVTRLSEQAAFDARAGRLTWRLPLVEAGTENVLRFTAKAVAEGDFAPRIVLLDHSRPVAVAAYDSSIQRASPETQIAERQTRNGAVERPASRWATRAARHAALRSD